ncbi:MAG: response regulator [Proteobacteria bacterium]|nr:response regulator [Pseudomonadota bacterium]
MAQANSNEAEEKGPQKGLVLVVDDDSRTQRLEKFVLEEEGFPVETVGSGEEALAIIKTISPVLILLDVNMPGIDGFTTCQRIREFSQVPIIMVTGENRDEAKVRGLEDGGARLAELTAAEKKARDTYGKAAEVLSRDRKKAAAKLDKAVARELKPLKLEKAKFTTAIDGLAEDSWGPEGRDKVVFLVATNPGAPAGPLGKISSGGELARFTLALKAVLAQADPVPTLVFDEVDSGVGGAVAAAVGERLAGLAGAAQVLVVTHSPQVAAKGKHHWLVSKSDADQGVFTTVDALSDEGRKEEIARMLAGAKITEEARAAADSLLEGACP